MDKVAIMSHADLRSRAVVDRCAVGLAVAGAVSVAVLTAFWIHNRHQIESPKLTPHICICAAVAIYTLIAAWRSRGLKDDAANAAIRRAVYLFGAVALAILMFRLEFSRSVLSTYVITSLGFSVPLAWAKAQRHLRVAHLVQQSSTTALISDEEIVDDPEADLTRYDVILMDFKDESAATFAQGVSRALRVGASVRHPWEYTERKLGRISPAQFELEFPLEPRKGAYAEVKRVVDVIMSLILAVLVSPIILMSIILVVLTSGRPIFYLQERIGLGGQVFRMWKLRTMKTDGNVSVEKPAVRGDPRVTPIGRILRRTRIDELPQLWNVIKGDMSIIGPRPEMVSSNAVYLAEDTRYAYRTMVRPGITGWAQVRAAPSEDVSGAMMKLSYDLYYVKYESLALDAYIAVRTLWTLVHGGGVR